MHLKRKKTLFLAISIPVVLILAFISSVKQPEIIKENLSQKILSLDLGFSSFMNLIETGDGIDRFQTPFNEKLFKLIASLDEAIPKIIKYKLFNKNEFDRVDIHINFADYIVLMEDRDRAIKNTILSKPTKINSILEYKGEKIKAKIRLKGDLYGHWTSKYRYSLRVELKNDKTILGFSRFSIQKPRERRHPYDYTFQSMLKSIGNIASPHNYVHVFVNGENWGIMDMEEHISKELLEKQNRKDSVVVRFSDEKKWLYERTSAKPYDNYKLSDPLIFLHLYNTKRYLKNLHNRKIYSYIFNSRISKNNIYDTDSFSKALILSLVWNNSHSLANPNARYYFNPYTLMLEPITTDQGHWTEIQDRNIELFESTQQYFEILSNQEFLDNLDMNLSVVSETVSNINKHLSYPQSLFPVDRKKSVRNIKDNIEKIINNEQKYLVHPIMNYGVKNKSNNNNLATKPLTLPTEQQASEFIKHLHIKHYTNGTLELYNLIPDNVAVKAVIFDGNSFTDKEIIIPSYISNPKPTIIKTLYKGIQDDMFTVHTQYQGFKRTTKNDITLVSEGIDNPLLLDTAHEFNFIERLNEKTYKFNQGSWTVNKPIIVDGDLHISPGTKLRFTKNAYIIIKGSLTAIGEESNPITLKAALDSWKGVYVINAGKKSYLKNVNISNISSLEDGLLKLAGGITFYKSDVDIENVRISNVKAEDAINIVESSFSLNSVFIDNTVFDGLDSDFSKGSVLHSKLSNIGGDALDFSGSNVSIINTKASNVKDKAVSAGEKSVLNIENSQFSNIGIGVASKDGSVVNVSNTTILDYKLYAAMSYIKKDFYSSPKININNCIVSDDNAYIRQKGTSMIVDNIEISESEISVEKLYK